MSPTEQHERIAVLETKVEEMKTELEQSFMLVRKFQEEMLRHMVEEEKRWAEIHSTMTAVANTQVQDRRFLGGVVLGVSGVVSVLWAFLTGLPKFWHWLQGLGN